MEQASQPQGPVDAEGPASVDSEAWWMEEGYASRRTSTALTCESEGGSLGGELFEPGRRRHSCIFLYAVCVHIFSP